MNNVVLIGYRCTGKSTVARALGRMLHLPVMDTDDIVQARVGQSISRMVAERGWSFFRAHEHDVIEEVAAAQGRVIATGGGAVENGDNRRCLSEGNLVVWLTAERDAIVTRMIVDGKSEEERPPLSHDPLPDEIELILEQRMPLYREMADLIIDTTVAAADEAAFQILDYINKEGKEICQATP